MLFSQSSRVTIGATSYYCLADPFIVRMKWLNVWENTWLTVKHPAAVKTWLFIAHHSHCCMLLSLRACEEVFWVPHLTLALSNWNPGNRGCIVCRLRILLGLPPFSNWEGAVIPPAEPHPGEEPLFTLLLDSLRCLASCPNILRGLFIFCQNRETSWLYSNRNKAFLRPKIRFFFLMVTWSLHSAV